MCAVGQPTTEPLPRQQLHQWDRDPPGGVQCLPGLATLPAPFTLSQARQALDTTRRVVVPLMELLARKGFSRRLPDGAHELR